MKKLFDELIGIKDMNEEYRCPYESEINALRDLRQENLKLQNDLDHKDCMYQLALSRIRELEKRNKIIKAGCKSINNLLICISMASMFLLIAQIVLLILEMMCRPESAERFPVHFNLIWLAASFLVFAVTTSINKEMVEALVSMYLSAKEDSDGNQNLPM